MKVFITDDDSCIKSMGEGREDGVGSFYIDGTSTVEGRVRCRSSQLGTTYLALFLTNLVQEFVTVGSRSS